MKMHTFMISEDVLNYYRQLAKERDRPASELLRRALDEFIERERKKAPPQKAEQSAAE